MNHSEIVVLWPELHTHTHTLHTHTHTLHTLYTHTHTHTAHTYTHTVHTHTHCTHTHTHCTHTYTHTHTAHTYTHTLHTHAHTHTCCTHIHAHCTHTHMYTLTDAVGLLGDGALGIGGGGVTHDHHGDTGTDLLLIHHTDMIPIGREDRRMYGWADEWINRYYSSSFSAIGNALVHVVAPPPLTSTTVDSLRGIEEEEGRRRRETKGLDHPSRSKRRRNQGLQAARS